MTYANDTARPHDGAIDLYRELVVLDGGEGRTTSRQVAAKFGKAHKDVLRSIDTLQRAIKSGGAILRRGTFEEVFRIDGRGKAWRDNSGRAH